jgi:hypothetical protein
MSMTREDVVRIAIEVGFYDGEVDKCQLMLERFAYLVAKQEREAILAVIGDNQCECRCSEVVRNRGQA